MSQDVDPSQANHRLKAHDGTVREAWPEFLIGLPCVVLTVATRAVFTDGDSMLHVLTRTVALILVAVYATTAVAPLILERRHRSH